jgi:hypothetical protein
LALRHVRVQDAGTFVPLTTAAELRVAGSELPKGAVADLRQIDFNDPELRLGQPPESRTRSVTGPGTQNGHRSVPSDRQVGMRTATRSGSVAPVQQIAFHDAGSGTRHPAAASIAAGSAPQQLQTTEGILLVHGYCSGLLWPQWEFDDGPTVEFSDVNQNRSHNAFAQRIAQQGDQAFSNSFTVVAHSQGGAATLELYTRYWSGLDYTGAPRRIQTLGTPYWGTPLAGLIAWIGQVFGASCGPNWDLTHLGSALWLSTIPGWARNQVHYWTTAHDKWWIFEGVCHASSLVLSGIDDGVISVWAGQLPGGYNHGMRRDWCHSSSMVDAPQYLDASRNSEMDVYGRVNDSVGIIPATGSCPNGQGVSTIYMDDEDHNNANGRGGWIGATTSTNNTTFRFCRVSGSLFRALATTNQVQHHYAVLKLGSVCPAGSVEFARAFDNEDHNNQNWASGPIAPNSSTHNTVLVFCLFRSAATTMSGFPNLGIAYGVFADSTFSQALATGYVYTDDEDFWNANGYAANAAWLVDAQRIISGGSNTTLKLARVH